MENTTPLAKRISLSKATSVFASMTMLSRILGFARDMLTAYLFGASFGTDAFLVAFKIPNFMRRLFAEGAFSQAFVPILAEYQQTKSHDEVKQFIRHTAGMLGLILLIFTVVTLFAAPFLVRIFAPGFDPNSERFIWASDMLRITFPYLMLISLAALAGAVLNTYHRFGPPAFTPVLLNLAMIACALLLSPLLQPSIESLAWGVLLGGILQLIWQLPYLIKMDLFAWPQLKKNDPGVKRILKQMVPALFGVSVAQINLLFDTLFASFLTVGSISWLYFADRISSLPVGVFGVAIATVSLPTLSRHFTHQNHESFSKTMDWALKRILLVGLPSTIGLCILSKPLLITLLHYGHFKWHDVLMTERSLIAFGLGIVPFMAVKVLATAFYATHNIKTPVKIAAIALITNIILNFILIQFLDHAGLALATSITAVLNSGLLWWLLRKRKLFDLLPGWRIFLAKILIALSLMILVTKSFIPNPDIWLNWSWYIRVFYFSIWMMINIICYFGSLFVMKLHSTTE